MKLIEWIIVVPIYVGFIMAIFAGFYAIFATLFGGRK